MQRTRFLTPLLAIVLFAGVAASLSAETLREEFSERYSIASGGSFSVQNVSGNLEIVSWNEDEVLVEASKVVKTVGRDRAEEAMAALKIEVDESRNEIVVRTTLPRNSSGLMDWIFVRNVGAKVSYRIKVPGGIAVSALTVNGNVRIEAIDGQINAKTTNGQIRISEAGSGVSASTTNGSIRAEFRDLASFENTSFRATNGGITVYLPADLPCSVRASTVNGAVSTDFPITIEGSSGRSKKRLEGDINGGGGELSLRTVNGSIAVRKSS